MDITDSVVNLNIDKEVAESFLKELKNEHSTSKEMLKVLKNIEGMMCDVINEDSDDSKQKILKDINKLPFQEVLGTRLIELDRVKEVINKRV